MTENEIATLERIAAELNHLASERQGEIHQRLTEFSTKLMEMVRDSRRDIGPTRLAHEAMRSKGAGRKWRRP